MARPILHREIAHASSVRMTVNLAPPAAPLVLEFSTIEVAVDNLPQSLDRVRVEFAGRDVPIEWRQRKRIRTGHEVVIIKAAALHRRDDDCVTVIITDPDTGEESSTCVDVVYYDDPPGRRPRNGRDRGR